MRNSVVGLLCLGALLLVFPYHADARSIRLRNKNRRHKRPPPPEDADAAAWNVTGSEEGQKSLRAKAFSSSSQQIVVVAVFGGRRRERGAEFVLPATTLYDFSEEGTPVAVVKTRDGCYLLPVRENVTFASAAQQLFDNNGTEVEAPGKEATLNGTGEPLSEADLSALNTTNPAVVAFCGQARIVNTSRAVDPDVENDTAIVDGSQADSNTENVDDAEESDDETEDGDSDESSEDMDRRESRVTDVTVITLDKTVNILVNTSRRGRGKPSRHHGSRRGKGHKGRRGQKRS